MSPHLKERFFQRYFKELTPEILKELLLACRNAPSPGTPTWDKPGVYHITVAWRGEWVKMVWCPKANSIMTFLAPWMKTYNGLLGDQGRGRTTDHARGET